MTATPAARALAALALSLMFFGTARAEPDPQRVEAAWALLAGGDAAGAAEIFKASLDGDPTPAAATLTRASALAGLAMTRQWQGDTAGAIEGYEAARRSFRDAGHGGHPDLAAVLKNLADLKAATDPETAGALYREAIELWEPSLGAASEVVEGTRLALANVLLNQARYSDAIDIYAGLLVARRERLGGDHPATLEMYGAVASVHWATGEVDSARTLYAEALALVPGAASASPQRATLLDGAAKVAAADGDLDRALELAQRARSEITATAPDAVGRIVPIELHLATLHRDRGEFDRAEPLYRDILERLSRVGLAKSYDYATVLHEQGRLLAEMGDFERGELLLSRALERYLAALGNDHLFVATARGSLAALYLATDRLEAAAEEFEASLALYRRSVGEENLYTARALGNLAAVYQAQEDYAKARPLLEQAISKLAALLGPNHPDTLGYRNNLAVLLLAEKQYDAAHEALVAALSRVEARLGPEHPSSNSIRQNLAYVTTLRGERELGLALFRETLNAGESVQKSIFAIASERQKLAYMRKSAWAYERLLSLVHTYFVDDPEAIRQALDWVLRRKGAVFDVQSRQRESIARSLATDDSLRRDWQRLVELRADLARRMLAPESPDPQKDRSELIARIESLEADLAGRSQVIRREIESAAATSARIAEGLPTDTVLIEFVRFREVDWDQGRWADRHRYLAFVLRPGGSVRLVDLGDAKRLDAMIRTAHRALGGAADTSFQRARQQDAARRLHDAIWKPLAASVRETAATTRLVISPDGLLNLVPFAALIDEAGRFLIEDYAVIHLSSGRDLAGPGAPASGDGLFLLADPDYGPRPAAPEDGVRGASTVSLTFDPLPGTRREATGIAQRIEALKVTLVTGPEASEEAVLKAAGRRVLHLATHGFFLEALPESETRQSLRAAGLEVDFATTVNPLVRSGLALAGANRARTAAAEESDGILTALEVSALDLRGTDLVALSACDTGRGDILDSEGVFGLRRAFALAGARHLLLSLWPVADEATAGQMQTFYDHYGSSEPPADALRKAQLASINTLRKELGAAPPSIWAAFIIQGR
ncbi:MAG: CHAT domain-containing tetratricopeptide repeat protein [Pseudomonadota bacterium]